MRLVAQCKTRIQTRSNTVLLLSIIFAFLILERNHKNHVKLKINSRQRKDKRKITSWQISDKIKLDYKISKDKPLLLNHNPTLIEWVIENIVKNAVDAMDGEGSLKIELRQKEKAIEIDIIDNGRGMASNKFKTIFKPGFTSKKRGWGLGLPLAKRIIQDYHKGQVFVQKSELKVGTTIRVILPIIKN